MILSSTVLIGMHKALVSAFVGDLDGTNAQPPRKLGRPLNAVVDVILECHVLWQRQNARAAIYHLVGSLPAHLFTLHKVGLPDSSPRNSHQ